MTVLKEKDSKGKYLIKEIKVNYPDTPGLFYKKFSLVELMNNYPKRFFDIVAQYSDDGNSYQVYSHFYESMIEQLIH